MPNDDSTQVFHNFSALLWRFPSFPLRFATPPYSQGTAASPGWGTADKKTMEDDRNRESWEYMDIYGNIPYK